MKLGVIGTGTIVQEFLPRLVKMEGMEVVSVMDVPQSKERVEAMCATNGIQNPVTDFEDLCSTGIDTVYIAVPNFLHYDYCVKSLNKGLNVIVEKPMTSNKEEAHKLADMAKEKKCFLYEAVTTIHLDTFKKIEEWLPQIGTIKLVQAQYSQYSRRYDAFKQGQILPVFDPVKAGGALMDLNLYNLHFVMGLFGRPLKEIYYPNVEKNIDTSGVLVLEYDGFKALCVGAKDCKGNAFVVLQGDQGSIRCEYPSNLLGKVKLELNNGTVEEFDDGSQKERLIPEFKDFMTEINSGDYEACYRFLDKSVAVSDVQTDARRSAGIFFKADESFL